MRRMNRKTIILVLIAGLIAATLGLLLGQRLASSEPPEISGLLYPEPRPVPQFELVDGSGERFTREDLRGHWSWLFFGFTHCPDVCPTTLTTLDRALQAIPEGKPQPEVLFVSVDPQRDTADKIGAYVEYFNPDFRGVTGSQTQIEALTRALGIAYSYTPIEGSDNYTVDHTAAILLTDPDGRVVAVFTTPHKAQPLARDFLAIHDYLQDQYR